MPGYESNANTILKDLGFYPYDTPFETTSHLHTRTKYEEIDTISGDKMLFFANPRGGVKILVKFSP